MSIVFNDEQMVNGLTEIMHDAFTNILYANMNANDKLAKLQEITKEAKKFSYAAELTSLYKTNKENMEKLMAFDGISALEVGFGLFNEYMERLAERLECSVDEVPIKSKDLLAGKKNVPLFMTIYSDFINLVKEKLLKLDEEGYLNQFQQEFLANVMELLNNADINKIAENTVFTEEEAKKMFPKEGVLDPEKKYEYTKEELREAVAKMYENGFSVVDKTIDLLVRMDLITIVKSKEEVSEVLLILLKDCIFMGLEYQISAAIQHQQNLVDDDMSL